MKKYIIALLFAGSAGALKAQDHKLEKIWETDTVIRVPESVLADTKNKVLYVSEIDGSPDGKDGKGQIAKLDLQGKIINQNFITGLNAPKGMAKFGNELFISDCDEVVVADLKTGKILQKIPVPGAGFLNDADVDSKGNVYVTDSKTGKVHLIKNRKESTFVENIKGINGVRAIGNDVYVLGGPVLYKIGADKKPVKVAGDLASGGDGLEPLKNGDFIVSCWPGLIYYISAAGKIQLLHDSREQKINTADIGMNKEEGIIYVPTFFHKTVAAYRVK